MEDMLTNTCKKAFDLIPEEKRPDLQSYVATLQKYFGDPEPNTSWKDFFFPPLFYGDIAKYIFEEWEPKNSDIVIACYPKTGSTWVKEIVHQMIYRNDKTLSEKTHMYGPFFVSLEAGPKEKFQVINNFPMDRRILKTHIPAPIFNFEKFRRNGTKIIYMMRNPKDQVVSWFNFALKHPYIDKKPFSEVLPRKEKEFIDLAIAGKQKMFAKEGEGYLEHIRGWYEHKNDDNVMFLCYEDMQEDIFGQLKKISKFIGENLTEEEIKVVAEKTSFKSMKKNDPLNFARKGQVGGWKDHLTVAQSELIDFKVGNILGDTDIKFKYEL